MFVSLITAAVATTKWLTIAKMATTAGSVCMTIQPVADACRRR